MVEGVSKGFEKTLELVGVGYRAQKQGNKLVLNVGYSHPVEFEPEARIEVEVPSNTKIIVKGINKERVGALQLTFVMFAHQNLIKVKVSVTKVNLYVVKKVKLVSNAA